MTVIFGTPSHKDESDPLSWPSPISPSPVPAGFLLRTIVGHSIMFWYRIRTVCQAETRSGK